MAGGQIVSLGRGGALVVHPSAALADPAAFYEQACRMVAEAKTIDVAHGAADLAAAVAAVAKVARNLQLEVDACEVRIRAERRLGSLLDAAKAAGQISQGRPPKNPSDREGFSRATLADAGIGHKLSARAQRLAARAPAAFEADLGRWRARIERDGARVTARLERGDDKAAARAAREAGLAARIAALPEARFGVIYADPEWQFATWSAAGLDRAADNHYPTSPASAIEGRTLDVVTADGEVLARTVAELAAPDAALFLWVTRPMLPAGLAVMAAWGFGYRTCLTWHKTAAPRPSPGADAPPSPARGEGSRRLALGTGYWLRDASELLLIGTRGGPPAPAPGTQWPSALEAPRREHSRKPDEIYAMIEQYFQNASKLELNARTARPGWTSVIHDPDAGSRIVGPDGADVGVAGFAESGRP